MIKYKQFKFTDGQHAEKLATLFLRIAKEKYHINDIDLDLSDIHHYIHQDNINSFRMECFRAVNNSNWMENIAEQALENIQLILGKDLLIQKKINLSIQMPDDDTSLLPAHTDCQSGDSVFQLVVWIPLTNAFKTNSMFILSENLSIKYYEQISNSEIPKIDDSKIQLNNFIDAKVGEYIIFPSTLVHGNVLNRTNKTRFSLNFRVKSAFSPYQSSTPRERKYGIYYESWKKSEWFDFNIKAAKLLNS